MYKTLVNYDSLTFTCNIEYHKIVALREIYNMVSVLHRQIMEDLLSIRLYY